MTQLEDDINVSRREIASVVGAALGAYALASCTSVGSDDSTVETVASTSSALTGTGLTAPLTLAAALTANSTSATLSAPGLTSTQASALTGRVWVAFEAYASANCEVALVTGVNGTQVTFSPAVQFSHAANTYVVFLEQSVLTPQLFGAKGDGSTPADSAFNAMVREKDKLGNNQNNPSFSFEMYLPAGQYAISTNIDLGVWAFRLRGDGWRLDFGNQFGGAFVVPGSTIVCTSAGGLTYSQGGPGCELVDFAVQGPGSGTTTGIALSNDGGAVGVRMEHVAIVNFSCGFRPGASEQCSFYDLTIAGCQTGILMSSPGPIQVAFYQLWIDGSTTGILINDVAVVNFYGGTLANCLTSAISINAAGGHPRGIYFSGFQLVPNGSGEVLYLELDGGSISSVSIKDSVFATGGIAFKAGDSGVIDGLSLENCYAASIGNLTIPSYVINSKLDTFLGSGAITSNSLSTVLLNAQQTGCSFPAVSAQSISVGGGPQIKAILSGFLQTTGSTTVPANSAVAATFTSPGGATMPIAGANVGDVCVVATSPAIGVGSGVLPYAEVVASGQVSVQFFNVSSTPATLGTVNVRVDVIQH